MSKQDTIFLGPNADRATDIVSASDMALATRSFGDLRNARRKINARRLDSLREGGRQFRSSRCDSVDAPQGFHLAEDLEYIYGEVLRTEYEPNGAMSLFPLDTRVPAGARNHTVRRLDHYGKADWHRNDAKHLNTVGASQAEQTFPVKTAAVAIELDFFEQQASDFANSNLRGELEMAARATLMDFANEKIWHGDEDHGFYGVLNYPWLPKLPFPTAVNSSTNADTFLYNMHRFSNMPNKITKTVFTPNTIVTSPRLRSWMANTPRSSTSDTTILEYYLRTNEYIGSIVSDPEMQGIGDNGEDGMLMYRANDLRSIANVVPVPFAMLPMQVSGFNMHIPVYMRLGGVVMRNPLNNLLSYVSVDL